MYNQGAVNFPHNGKAKSSPDLLPSRRGLMTFYSQLIEGPLGGLQLGSLKAFGEAIVTVIQYLTGFLALTLMPIQITQTQRRSHFPVS